VNWVDLLVIALVLLAAYSGYRQGLVMALPAFLGVALGAFLGIKLAPVLIENFASQATRAAFAVGIVVLLAGLGETLGVWLGRMLRQRIRSREVAWVDSAFGAVLQGTVVFVISWVLALSLTGLPGMPGLVAGLKQSALLGAVDEVMPSAAADVPAGLRKLLQDENLPNVLNPFDSPQITQVDPPDTALQRSPIVQKVRPSVVKIRGTAPQCRRSLEGTGFVIGRERVLTNAHVVAGTDEVAVEVGTGRMEAHVILYNPDLDIALLSVPNLTATPLPLDTTTARSGEDAIVLGYPLDGPYTASAGRVRSNINLRGPNIYDSRTVNRDVYTLRAQVRSGNSGGPVIDPAGRVIGVVFGASVEDASTGFALTARTVQDNLAQAAELFRTVSTGKCAG
jgi:S1-C subfamily serine protease